MKTSILIVTFGRDFPWLKWCLRSVQKFASGFYEVCVTLPMNEPWSAVLDIANDYDGPVPLKFHTFDEWPGKGFVHHMDMICRADEICPKADRVLHIDPDCIFIDPVSPEDYFVDGKPVLIGARYDWIVKRFKNENHYRWQEAVEMAIGGKPEREWMRRHPAVHEAEVYWKTRILIREHTGMDASEYIASTKNSYPQTFAEFPTLGEVAWRHFNDRYHWIDQETGQWPKDKLIQFWGHGPMDKPNNVWLGGDMVEMVPIDVMKEILA